MMARKLWFVLLFMFCLLLSGIASAQEQPEVIASDLKNPRHVFYDDEGNLFIVEAGTGGDTEVEHIFGPVTVGRTGQVTVVTSEGEQSVALGELVSMDGGERGAMAILVTDGTAYLALGEGPAELPAELADATVMAVAVLDVETMEVQQVIDVFAAEEEQNPDGDIVLSNPSDLALAEDGTLYISDASANAVWKWTEADGLQLFASWSIDDNPVPTSVAIAPEGDIYVGFLSGFPFPMEGARIERYSPEGELLETIEGLTYVVDLLVDDAGTLYAVELAGGFGDTGFFGDSGRVVAVSADGITPYATGLNFPYGLEQNADGELVVAVNAFFSPPDSGQVIVLTEGMALSGAAPDATPEVEPAETPETSGG